MKIALVHESADPQRGGAESAINEMSAELAHLGHRVTVVVRSQPSAMRPTSGPDGVQVVALDVRAATRLAGSKQFVAQADDYCRAAAFDIVHAVTPCHSCNIYQPRGGTYAETIRRSLAVHRNPWLRALKTVGRSLNRKQRYLLEVEREILTRPSPAFVAAISDYVARQIQTDFPSHPAKRLSVVFNAITVPEPVRLSPAERATARRTIGLLPEKPLALFIANNFRLKGLAELLAALRHPELEKRGLLLAVCGTDDERPFLRSLRSTPDLMQRVKFLGPRRDLPQLFALSDVLAHPTWYDPCSRVVLEALTAGLPVVTTALNGAAEVVEPGVTGVVIPSPDDIAALASALVASLEPKMRESLESRAPKLRASLSMARHARELVQLYERAIR